MNVRLLGQLLDRVAAVAQDARVAVDVGDGALGRGGVDEAIVEGGVAGLGQQRTQRDAVGSLGGADDVQVKLATGVFEGGVLFTTGWVIGHGNPFVAAVNAEVCPTKGSPIPAVVPARGQAVAQTELPTFPISAHELGERRFQSVMTMSSMPDVLPVHTVFGRDRPSAVMMIVPHTAGHQPQPTVLEIDAHPLGQLDVDGVAAVLEGGLPQRRRGHDDPHDAHHPLG